MTPPKVVSRNEWLVARQAHLAKEKQFTQLRDELSAERRQLPWVRIDKKYIFDTATGQQSLSELFSGYSQLIVYHFMYGPDWEEGCPSCSFWADNFDGLAIHLAHRDISMVTVSRAPLTKLQTYQKRMGWSFQWVSSLENDFNRDFHVSFTPEEMDKGQIYYNYKTTRFPSSEGPGVSVFCRDDDGAVYHSYSCYARGLDMLNTAYHYMDLTPRGRDEQGLPYTMAWLRRRDQYEDNSSNG